MGSVSYREQGKGRGLVPLNIIIRSLISGCSTASMILSKPTVRFKTIRKGRKTHTMRHCPVCTLVRKTLICRSINTSEPLQQRRTKRGGQAVRVCPLVVIQVIAFVTCQFSQVGTASVSTYEISFPASSPLGSKASFSSGVSVIVVEL